MFSSCCYDIHSTRYDKLDLHERGQDEREWLGQNWKLINMKRAAVGCRLQSSTYPCRSYWAKWLCRWNPIKMFLFDTFSQHNTNVDGSKRNFSSLNSLGHDKRALDWFSDFQRVILSNFFFVFLEFVLFAIFSDSRTHEKITHTLYNWIYTF